jgi:hypothetical protein
MAKANLMRFSYSLLQILSSYVQSIGTKSRVLLILGLLFFFAPPKASSQIINGSSGSFVFVTVSATIQSEIQIETISNINFGSVSASATEIYINPRQDAGAGLLRIIGSPNKLINVSFLERQQLIRVGGGPSIFFDYEVSAASQDDQLISEPLTIENRQIQLSGDGEFYFWIGGRLTMEGMTFGQYEGEFTLEIDYL